jgi:hypothetical protein
MKHTLALFLLLVCLALILPTSARADGGGWPTATPTITPTSLPTNTPLIPTAVIITPTSAYPYPATGSMITPPALTPLPVDAPKNDPNAPAVNSELATSPTPSPASNNLLGGGIACWPIAIVALLVGIFLLNWLRSGMKKGS